MHLAEKEKRNQGKEHVNPIEFFDNAGSQHSQLCDETHWVVDNIGRIGFFVLTACERMNKALDRSRIAPFHWGIGHARQWHIKIEESAQDPTTSEADHHQP